MEEELKLDQAVPTLTFEPFTETKKEAPAPQQEMPKPEPIYEEEALLSEQEKKQVEAFAEKIDLNNSTLVLQYGAGAQKKIADFSDKTLENVRSKDLGETGTMLASLVSELKQTGEPEEEKGFFASFFKKSTGKLEALKARYEKAEGKVDEIVDILTKHQVQLIQDAAMLDQMYQLNQTYFKELSMYILAGKKKVDKARQTELETLRQKAIASGTQEDAQAVSDYSSMIERFEKKVHDLELTRMVQSNDTVMAEKIQSTIVNTIPLWKNQMVIAMGENHSAQAAKAQKEVTDMTNQLLLSNAQKLKQTTVDIRRESERGIVDIETLRQTNGILIDTMNEILKIQQEGREQRRQAQAQLAQMEQQMKEKLLEISK